MVLINAGFVQVFQSYPKGDYERPKRQGNRNREIRSLESAQPLAVETASLIEMETSAFRLEIPNHNFQITDKSQYP
jgi:hypothetical protein